MSSDSARTLEWAETTVGRRREIIAGHIWIPDGWRNCRLRLWTGEFDRETVTVQTIEVLPDESLRKNLFVWRAELDELEQEIHQCLAEIQTISDDPDLGVLASVPLPKVPPWLNEALKVDMADIALRTFGEAQSVIDFHLGG